MYLFAVNKVAFAPNYVCWLFIVGSRADRIFEIPHTHTHAPMHSTAIFWSLPSCIAVTCAYFISGWSEVQKFGFYICCWWMNIDGMRIENIQSSHIIQTMISKAWRKHRFDNINRKRDLLLGSIWYSAHERDFKEKLHSVIFLLMEGKWSEKDDKDWSEVAKNPSAQVVFLLMLWFNLYIMCGNLF